MMTAYENGLLAQHTLKLAQLGGCSTAIGMLGLCRVENASHSHASCKLELTIEEDALFGQGLG